MKSISFYGSTTFSLEILKKLYKFHKEGKVSLKYVISQSSKPFGRKKELKDNPVVEFCKKEGILLFTPLKIKDLFHPKKLFKSSELHLTPDILQKIEQNDYDFSTISGITEALATDLSFVAAYGKILPKQILDTAREGFINFHGSLLPKLRGAAPVQFTILNQDPEVAGISVIKMDEGMDTGDIISNFKFQTSNDNLENMTAGELMEELAKLCTSKLEDDFEYIFNPEKWNLVKQDNEKATYCYAANMVKQLFQINYEDGEKLAHGKIMAANPDPIAWILIYLKKEMTKVNLIRSKLVNDEEAKEIDPKGELALHYNKNRKKLYLELQTGIIEIPQIQPVGKKVMLGSEFGNGYL